MGPWLLHCRRRRYELIPKYLHPIFLGGKMDEWIWVCRLTKEDWQMRSGEGWDVPNSNRMQKVGLVNNSLLPKYGPSGTNKCEDGSKQVTKILNSQLKPMANFILRCFHEKLGGTFSLFKKQGRIWKECRSNEHFNVWLNKSTVFSEQRREQGVCGESANTGLRMEAEPSTRTMGFCVHSSLPISLFLQLQLLPIQVYSAGGYSLENKLCAYVRLRLERGLCWLLSPSSFHFT